MNERTMKPVWLLEKDTFPEVEEEFKKIVESLNLDFQFCEYFYENNTLEVPNKSLDDLQPKFVYGSLQLAQYLHKGRIVELKNVIHYCNFKQLECSYYYPRLNEYLLQQNYIFVPFGLIKEKKDWLLSHVGDGEKVFIRPNDGKKTFSGTVAYRETWDENLRLMGFYDVQPEHMCVVAEPKNIISEYRFVIGSEYCYLETEQDIITSCCYLKDKKEVENQKDSETPIEVANFVQEVLKNTNYNPDPFWIMDVCQTNDGNFYVLEVGSISCSGLYFCNLQNIVSSISKYIDKEHKDIFGN